MNRMLAAGAALLTFAAIGTAAAAEKPDHLKIGITTYLTGPASVFGVPGKNAAEILIKHMNEDGGIGGVPIEASFIDEGAGKEALLAEFKRQVQEGHADAMFASISSGNCKALAPVAEDLKVIDFLWDCGTQHIFEDDSYEWAFRTQAYGTPEMLSTVLYLLKTKPDFKTIAVVNQDYAWGRDSWALFSTALKAMKPDVKVVGEFFPKFGTPDFSTEVSRLQALHPDVILSTSWGGDLDTFVRQASQRGLMQTSTFVLPLAESSLERLGAALPPGQIIGARGDHYFLNPKIKDDPDFQAFLKEYHEKTGAYPIYPCFHMAQALAALKGGYEKAIKENNGEWPTHEQVAKALVGLDFHGFGNTVHIREDHQGVEDQLLGTSAKSDEYDFAVLENMMLFDGDDITTPVGKESLSWLSTLTPEFVEKAKVEKLDGGS